MTRHKGCIVREVLDTLYEAKGAILGLTALDTQLEMQIKIRENECATTRRIDRAVTALQQLEEPNPWHKASEELPEKGQLVLISNPAIQFAIYDGQFRPVLRIGRRFEVADEHVFVETKYWMEIPEVKED